MSVRHLNPVELATRWQVSHRTLERWRQSGDGPLFLKVQGRVVYRQEDIEAFEQARLCIRTGKGAHRVPTGAGMEAQP